MTFASQYTHVYILGEKFIKCFPVDYYNFVSMRMSTDTSGTSGKFK